jgi:hypothetical protein
MFADIRNFVALRIPQLSMLTEITGQPADQPGHLTAGLNYADASITGASYDKFASPFLFS